MLWAWGSEMINLTVEEVRGELSGGRTRALYFEDALWERVFPWWPVWPEDESECFLLQYVWRARSGDGRWRYRTFRTDEEKLEGWYAKQW